MSAEISTSTSAVPTEGSITHPAEATAGEVAVEDKKDDEKPTRETADRLLAEGSKLAALKKREEAVAKFADALEIMGELVGELDPAMAPFLLSYGKALYELALSQSGVMGKEEVQKGTQGQLDAQDTDEPSTLVESADPEIIAAAEAEAAAAEAEAGDGEGKEEEAGDVEDEEQAPAGDDDAPEDDFNAAWEVLDVARTIYGKVVQDKKDKKEVYEEDDMRLAECYLFLGDVSCETENFDQAVSDYTSALTIQKAHLPAGSRALASSHFQLGTVLEFLPGKRAEALSQVQEAIEGFRVRESLLITASTSSNDDGLIPELAKLGAKEREAELKDTREFIGDLEAKLEELKVAPEQEDLVSQGIKHFLGGSAEGAFASAFDDAPAAAPSSAAEAAPVNTLMVKKKKKPVAAPVPAPANGNALAEQVKAAVADAAVKVGEAVEAAAEGVKRTAAELAEGAEGVMENANKKPKTE